jgi:membrane protein required for colicin V production
MSMAVIDIVFLGLIALLIIRSGLRGFIKEIMSMAGVGLGLLAAVLFYRQGAAFVRTKILEDVKALPELIAFVSLLAIVFIAIKILENVLKDIVARINMGGLDHALGLAVGLLEGLVMVRLLLFVLDIQPLFDAGSLLENSVIAKILDPLAKDLKLPSVGAGRGV